MPAKLPPTYVGLDIGSDQLDCSRSEHDEERHAYTPEGIAALIKTIQLLLRARVICEASGGYEKRIVAELLQAGIEVCVVQPGRVRAFAYAEGLTAKTDRIDARLLRRFGEKIEVRLALPTDPVLATLRELLEHRRQLTTQLAELSSRLALAGATWASCWANTRLFLEKQITEVEGLIKDHLDQNRDLKKKSARLREIKGVGPILSATVLAYIPELGQIESSQLSALIGVALHPDDSGRHTALATSAAAARKSATSSTWQQSAQPELTPSCEPSFKTGTMRIFSPHA